MSRPAAVCVLILASGLALARADDDAPSGAPPLVEELDAAGTYLMANARDADGTPAFVHVTPEDMPLRIAISLPRVPAKDGNRAAAREAAVQGMMLWEAALAPSLPWFRLAFVEEDETAPIQVMWKRRMTGDAAGRGWLLWSIVEGKLRIGGRVQVTMQPYLPRETPLELEELRFLLAHEFGHVLGLGHCLSCDSAMNYSWHTRDRIFVTAVDVATFRALVAKPSGVRVDGKPLAALTTMPPP